MLDVRRFGALLFVATPLIGCSGGDSGASETKCEQEGSRCAEEPVVLCDGSSSLKFAGISGGGNLGGVPRVAREVGWSFLLVDGNCRYWTMTEPNGPIRTGMLNEAWEADFSSAFRLGTWTADDTKADGCVDAGGTQLRFADTWVTVACTSTDLTTTYSAWLESLHEMGTRSSGDLRYTVTDASEESWVVGNTTDIASAWPLEGAPSATLERGADETAEPVIASGEDAEALRDARDAYAARGASTGPWLRIPMMLEVAGDGARYFDVAMRDVTPFERDGELRVDDFFAE